MANACVPTNELLAKRKIIYGDAVENSITQFLGKNLNNSKVSKKVADIYEANKQLLRDWFLSFELETLGRIQDEDADYFVDIISALRNITEGLRRENHINIFSKEYLLLHKNAYNYNKLVYQFNKKMFDKLAINQNKDIANWKRSFYFPYTVASEYDKYGILPNLVHDMQNNSDSALQYFSKEKQDVTEAQNKLKNYVEELFKNNQFNYSGKIYQPITTWATGVPIYFKNEFDEDMPLPLRSKIEIKDVEEYNGEITHVIVTVTKPGEKKSEHVEQRIPIEELNTQERKSSAMSEEMASTIREQYSSTLIHQLLRGQARYFKYETQIKLTEANLEKVNNILLENDVRKTNDKIGSGKIHSFQLSKGSEVRYVMIKQGEENRGEEYLIVPISLKTADRETPRYFFNRLTPDPKTPFARPNYAQETREIDRKIREKLIAQLKAEMPEGMYISNTEKSFGKKYNTNFRPTETTEKQYINFEPVNIDMKVVKDFFHTDSGIWEALFKIRGVLKIAGDRIANKVKLQDKNLKVLYARALKSGITAKQVTDILDAHGLHSKVWVDYFGGIHTNNTEFRRMAENYAPIMYDKMVYEKFLLIAIEDIEWKIEESIEMEDWEKHKSLTKHRDSLRLQYNSYMNPNYNPGTLSETDVFLKTRKPHTDSTLARTDNGVFSEYLTRQANIFSKNDRMTSLLEGVLKVKKLYKDNSETRVDFLVNEFRIMSNDVRASHSFGSLEYGYTSLSESYNTKKWLPGKITPEGLERFVKITTGTTSAGLLGTMSAITNRFQTVNGVIIYGLDIYREMEKQLKDEDKARLWENRLNKAGIRNVIEMFHELFFGGNGGNSAFLSEYGVAGVLVGFPLKSGKQLLSMLRLGKGKFIAKARDSEFGEYLKEWEKSRAEGRVEAYSKEQKKGQKKFSKIEKRLRDVQKSGGTTVKQVRDIEQVLGLYYDMMSATGNADIIAEKIKALMPNIASGRLGQMVNWKLSAGLMHTELTTFTGSEQKVRDEIFIMSVIAAGKANILSGTEGQLTYDTKLATQIGRDAVYSMAYGMTPIWLPGWLGGLGKLIGQYKPYLIHQTKFELQIIKNFLNSGKPIEPLMGIARAWHLAGVLPKSLLRLAKVSSRPIWARMAKGKITADEEALIMIRFLVTRVAATFIGMFRSVFSFGALGGFVSLIPFVGRPFKMLQGSTAPIRGLESPATMILSRLLAESIFYFAFYEDDDEDFLDFISNIYRILFFPLLSIMLDLVGKGYLEAMD